MVAFAALALVAFSPSDWRMVVGQEAILVYDSLTWRAGISTSEYPSSAYQLDLISLPARPIAAADDPDGGFLLLLDDRPDLVLAELAHGQVTELDRGPFDQVPWSDRFAIGTVDKLLPTRSPADGLLPPDLNDWTSSLRLEGGGPSMETGGLFDLVYVQRGWARIRLEDGDLFYDRYTTLPTTDAELARPNQTLRPDLPWDTLLAATPVPSLADGRVAFVVTLRTQEEGLTERLVQVDSDGEVVGVGWLWERPLAQSRTPSEVAARVAVVSDDEFLVLDSTFGYLDRRRFETGSVVR